MLVVTTVGEKSLSWLKGQLGLDGWETGLRRQPRGQVWFQGGSTSETFTETYAKLDRATTLDAASAIQFDTPSNNGRLRYVGSASRWFNVIGTVDVSYGPSSAVQISIKLAKNGSVIDATQCNATIAGNGAVAKLHSMWILPMKKDDYVEIFIATAAGEGSKTLTPVRSRLQATCLS